MATDRVNARFADLPLQNLKADLKTDLKAGEGPRLNLTPRGALVDQARKNAGIEVKQLAAVMGVSESFLLRGFKDQEHLSWQRLQQAASVWPVFHREFLILQAREVAGVEVCTDIRIRESA